MDDALERLRRRGVGVDVDAFNCTARVKKWGLLCDHMRETKRYQRNNSVEWVDEQPRETSTCGEPDGRGMR